MNVLKAEQISFCYGGEAILNRFSFKVGKGEKLGLTGPSGTGKSTLLRLILGFEFPREGQLFYRNKPLDKSQIRLLRSETAWLPQDLNMGTGTVREVIHFPFRFGQNREAEPVDDHVISLMESLGLPAETLDKTWNNLSTGQRQRAGIVLLVLMNKPLILLDEPTSALDEMSKQKAADLLFRDRSRTILSITHDNSWLDHCDRIINLNPLK